MQAAAGMQAQGREPGPPTCARSMVDASLPAGTSRLAALGRVGHSSSVCSPGGGGGTAAGCGGAAAATVLAAALAAQEVAVDSVRDGCTCMPAFRGCVGPVQLVMGCTWI